MRQATVAPAMKAMSFRKARRSTGGPCFREAVAVRPSPG